MGIYQRQDSPYWWMALERPGRRPLRKSTMIHAKAATPAQTKDNRVLAEQAYHAEMGDLARHRYKLTGPSTTRAFAAHAAWYETHHTATHRGADRERYVIQQLVDGFGSLTLDEIRPSRWTEYATRRRLTDGVSINTVGKELTLLKSILRSALGEWLDVSPLASVKRKSERLAAKRTITKAEEPAFLRALRAEDRELHDLYVVGVGTLLRQENLLALRRQDHRGTRLVLITKTGPHQVPLTGPTPLQRRAAAVLKRRMPKKATGYFFPRWHAHFAQYVESAHARVQFLRIVRRAAAAAKIPWGLRAGGIVWHTATRATGATRLMREFAIDVRTVQIIGGWTSLDQMSQYLGIDRSLFT